MGSFWQDDVDGGGALLLGRRVGLIVEGLRVGMGVGP